MARNEGALLSGFAREASAKAYRLPVVRAAARAITRRRYPETWVFVLGCYNSGTTLLRRLLEAHPLIAGLPIEGVKLTDAFPDLEDGGWPRMMYMNRHLWDLPQAGAKECVDRAIHDWSPWWPRKATIFLEKSIDNATRTQWLDAHFPNARFVAITRNGYCVCEGIRRRAKPQGLAVTKIGLSYPIALVAEQWAAFADRIESDIKAVRHGFVVRYEDLTADPLNTLGSIFDFVGVPRPAMTMQGRLLKIGDKCHEVRDQNAASIARLSPVDIAEATPILKDALQRNHYQLLDSINES